MFDWNSHLVVIGLLSILYCFGLSYYSGRKLKKFPTLGSTSPILSFIDTVKFLKDPVTYVHDGVNKFQGALFRIPAPIGWWVVVSDQKLINDLTKAPDHILSLNKALTEELQTKYTMGLQLTENPYHLPLIRHQLTRALPSLVPEMYAEMLNSFSTIVPVTDDWSSLKILDTSRTIVAFITGRVFVGLPLSRNQDWVQLNLDYATDLMKAAFILRLFPTFLRPLVNPFISKVPMHRRRGLKFLEPLISARRKLQGQQSPETSFDMLSWLLAEAKGEEATNPFIAARVFALYFASIHTTSMGLTQALLYLALLPEYCKPLRDEVEEVIHKDGWTKDALDRMSKVDSFIKESQRLHPVGSLMMSREALVDYTFSDGTTVPAGTTLCVSTTTTHLNPDHYEDPSKFDGFRFSKMNESAQEDSSSHKFDMVSTSCQYLGFSHGRHACPGRFFAAAELKMIFAYILITYDLKLANGVRPPDLFILQARIPNPGAEILFRRRAEDVSSDL